MEYMEYMEYMESRWVGLGQRRATSMLINSLQVRIKCPNC
jgi:hypothetical protein